MDLDRMGTSGWGRRWVIQSGRSYLRIIFRSLFVTHIKKKSGWRRCTREDPYSGESKVGADFRGDTGVLGLWAPCCMCVFNISVVDTDS